jgi:hypothetical protein
MNQQHEKERSCIRAAINRLLAGRPTRSNGSLTAVALAAEQVQAGRTGHRAAHQRAREDAGALWGASPIEYSSGRRSMRRLNHGGDRQANAALHRIVFTYLRHDLRTQAYYERRTQEGKTRREIIRCLKRYAAHEVFNLVGPVSRAPAL